MIRVSRQRRRGGRAVKVWLDDVRPAPAGWTWVKTAPEAIAALKRGGVEAISIDHDLGEDPGLGSGYDVATFVELEAFHGRIARLVWSIHSANPVGVARMRRALESAERFWASAASSGTDEKELT